MKYTQISEEKQLQIRNFRDVFNPMYGEGHMIFLWHAAYPVVFSPDMLYHIWANFKAFQDAYHESKVRTIHRLAVSDLLLSSLCQPVGTDLFEMDREIREVMIENLMSDERFGANRIHELADFLTAYTHKFYGGPKYQNLREVHLWTAMATKQPALAANTIIQAYTQAIHDKNNGEILRLYSFLSSLLVKDESLSTLQAITNGVKEHLAGNTEHTVRLPVLSEAGVADGTELLKIPIPKELSGRIQREVRERSVEKIIEQARTTQARSLDLGNRPELTEFPEEIMKLTHLESITIGGSENQSAGIRQIPNGISRLKRLKTLNLAFNFINELPRSFSKLSSLESVNLSNNQFSKWPESIRHLKSLKTLDLSYNRIAEIPEDVIELEQLETLLLAGNPLKTPPSKVANGGLNQIKEFFNTARIKSSLHGKNTSMRFEQDVYISYAHIDNQPISEDDEGWVSYFHNALQSLVSMKMGENVRIWRDNKLKGSDILSDEIVQQFPKTKLFIAVLSPRYINSDWCVKEIKEFYNSATQNIGVRIGNKSRILKVVKTPVEMDKIPPELEGTLGYEFYKLDENGRLREFNKLLGEDAEKDFLNRMDDLAEDIAEILMIPKVSIEDKERTDAEKKVYLICDSRDHELTLPLGKYLISQNFEVTIPLFEGDPSTIRQDQEENLRTCDAVIIFYGNGDELWKRSKVNELKKIYTYKRTKPLLANYLYLAKPSTTDKMELVELNMSNVINGLKGFSEDIMQEFMEKVTQH